MLLILGLMLACMWLWRASRLETEYPAVDYSQMFQWLAAGKLKAVDLKGHVLRGELNKPEKLGGHTIAAFRTNLPTGDTAVLPLLRDLEVDIPVESESQPFAVEPVLNLLPWVLIIGAWVMSRRARRLMAAGGGALGAILPSRSRRFDKTSQVGVAFDDVAGSPRAASAPRPILEVHTKGSALATSRPAPRTTSRRRPAWP